MNINDKVLETVYSAIGEINIAREGKPPLQKEVNTVLFGPKGKLDSLGLVNLIVLCEQKVEEEFQLVISLMDERAMNQEKSPFKSIGTLAAYITLLYEENLK